VGVWTCNGQANQQFALLRGGQIQPASSATRVLDVNNYGTADGTPVQLFAKKSLNPILALGTKPANQQFTLRMTLGTPWGQVMDVNGGQPASLNEGQSYDTYTANGGPNQSFDFWP
jgi:hypothetical protein